MLNPKETKIVILAAGMSTRLKSAVPKCLIPLKNEETIMDLQLKNIAKVFPLTNVYVVVGFKKELIMEKYPDLTFIYNNNYAFTNTGKSLLKALMRIDSDVVWLNGDVFFDANVLSLLLQADSTCVMVDNKKCAEEEIKYTLDQKGFVKNISKEVVGGLGEALGINYVRREDLPLLIKHLDRVSDQDYYEKGLENMILGDSVKVKPIHVGNIVCKEIDFQQDLKEVRQYIQGV